MATRISLLGYSIKTLDFPKDISATFAWVQYIDGKAIPMNDIATTMPERMNYLFLASSNIPLKYFSCSSINFSQEYSFRIISRLSNVKSDLYL